MTLSVEDAKKYRIEVEKTVHELEDSIKEQSVRLNEHRGILYEATLRETHLKEIYRQAEVQFSRLRKDPGLTVADAAELEKLIRREKTIEGLARIADSLKELQKYQPSDIRKSLYALVQKIIIEGAYKGKKRPS